MGYELWLVQAYNPIGGELRFRTLEKALTSDNNSIIKKKLYKNES